MTFPQKWITATLVVFGLLLAAVALAHPTGEFSEFYRALQRPDQPEGMGCCNDMDCAVTEARVKDGAYEAWVDDRWAGVAPQWVKIPADKIITDRPNLTGQPVVCYLPGVGVLCFMRGGET